ncbi:hypothetical protein [Enterobacter phage 02_vB_Eclo_IJM]|nr:hypothetical protein [Enterobacter phage 02_vB_Eclo_IJM]
MVGSSVASKSMCRRSKRLQPHRMDFWSSTTGLTMTFRLLTF